MNDTGIARLLLPLQTGPIAQNLRKGQDRGHGRAQFMADLRQKGVLLDRYLG